MPTPPIIDEFGNFLGSFGANISFTAATLQPGDVILCFAGVESGQQIASVTVTASSPTSPTLTWTRRANLVNAGNSTCSYWWLPIPSGVTSVTTQIVWNSVPSGYDDSAGHYAVIRGCANPNSPFDSNASWPLAWFGNPPGTKTYSTDTPDCLLMYWRGGQNINWSPPPGLAPSGFTSVDSLGNSGAFGFMSAQLSSKILTGTVSGATINDDSNVNSPGACLFLDALTGDTISPPAFITAPAIIRPTRSF